MTDVNYIMENFNLLDTEENIKANEFYDITYELVDGHPKYGMLPYRFKDKCWGKNRQEAEVCAELSIEGTFELFMKWPTKDIEIYYPDEDETVFTIDLFKDGDKVQSWEAKLTRVSKEREIKIKNILMK